MKFILNKDKLTIEDKGNPNSGSVKYYEAEVEFDESWEGLTIEARFIEKYEETGTSIAVINNKVYIDKNLKGTYYVGFVGYTIENNEKTYQISSDLKYVTFKKGAGEIETENEEVPTPSEWEIYIAQIQEMLDNVNGVPNGGTTGQVLAKKSNADKDVEWKTIQGGGTATNIDNQTITHNDNDEIQTVGIIDNNTGNVDKIWIGTKEEYNLIQDKDSSTIYILTNDDTSITDIKVNNVSVLNNGIANISVPTSLSELIEDSTHRTVSDTEKQTWNNKSEFSGSYNDLSNKPTIPAEVTETTVSNWGFTKNTGTYSKPSEGIPKNDLSSDVQTSLGKADTALQSYTEQYTGTITGITMNGASKGTIGVVDLGTVITSHQDLSDYELKPTTISSSETTASITPQNNTIYQFDELTSLTITNPPATGAYSIIFTSGATATTTVIPNTMLGLEDFAAEANTVYEINVFNNRAVVGSWAVSV